MPPLCATLPIPISTKGSLWGSATAAYRCEGAWDEDGKA
ncbi:family 1 glycosylhydrolase [Olsenella profusa]|nr:family 1 glycosylhydrolase [Olsenella profusa]